MLKTLFPYERGKKVSSKERQHSETIQVPVDNYNATVPPNRVIPNNSDYKFFESSLFKNRTLFTIFST